MVAMPSSGWISASDEDENFVAVEDVPTEMDLAIYLEIILLDVL